MRHRPASKAFSFKNGRNWGRYRSKPKPVPTTIKILGAAAALGLLVGIGSVGITAGGPQRVVAVASSFSVKLGFARARSPHPGDYWSACAQARAAGTAPIYRGEPGYRSALDGDDDGIACEPYHGR